VLTALVTRVVTAPRRVLLSALAFLVVAGVVGGGVAGSLSAGGFDDPDAQAVRATALLDEQFGGGAPNVLLLVTAPAGVDDAAAAAAGRAVTEQLAAEPGIAQVTSYWSSGAPALRSDDGTQALVLARLTGTEDEQIARVEELAPRYQSDDGAVRVQLGGEVEVFRQIGDTIERDLKRAESVVFPITAVLLVLVFGSAVAAGLPLLVGVLSILGTFLSLQLLSQVTDVSVYSLNLAISLGLGLGIDYSLFMLTRYREERAAGRTDRDAVVRTVRTAGRTVLFSAVTVLLSLSALLVFPLYFLRSFAYAGISAVLFAALGALVVLPAALTVLGPRIDALDLRGPLRRLLRLPAPTPRADGEGFWHRLALTVMRRPVPLATVVLVLLVTAGLPFSQVVFGLPDDRVLPRDASGHVIAQTVRDEFPSNEPLALTAVASAPDRSTRPTSTPGPARRPRCPGWPGSTRSPAPSSTATASRQRARRRPASPPLTART
jgi:RND superfamily putative drug exporter